MKASGDDAWSIYRDIIANDFGIRVGGGGGSSVYANARSVMDAEITHGPWTSADRTADIDRPIADLTSSETAVVMRIWS